MFFRASERRVREIVTYRNKIPSSSHNTKQTESLFSILLLTGSQACDFYIMPQQTWDRMYILVFFNI